MSKELSYLDAIREALTEEMRRDSKVFVLGEDVGMKVHQFEHLTPNAGLGPGTSTYGVGAVQARPIHETGRCVVLAADKVQRRWLKPT